MVGAFLIGGFGMPAHRCNVDLTADYGLYSGLFCLQVEIDNPMHSTVIGDGQTVHAQFFGPFDEVRNTTHAVKEAVFAMDMKMSEHSNCQ